MRLTRLSTVVLLLIVAGAVFGQGASATLTVHITGIRDHKGQLRVGVFNKADGWISDDAAITGQIVPLSTVTGNSTTVTLTGLKPGTYAVGVYHDRNMNNKLDKNFLGVPTEDWGVSNNVRPHLRAPGFNKAKFTLPASGKTIEIALHR